MTKIWNKGMNLTPLMCQENHIPMFTKQSFGWPSSSDFSLLNWIKIFNHKCWIYIIFLLCIYRVSPLLRKKLVQRQIEGWRVKVREDEQSRKVLLWVLTQALKCTVMFWIYNIYKMLSYINTYVVYKLAWTRNISKSAPLSIVRERYLK